MEKHLIAEYFKTLLQVLLVTILLSSMILIFCLSEEILRGKALLYSGGLFLLVIGMNLRKITFFIRVIYEYSNGSYSKELVSVCAIEKDRKFNYYSRGGVLEGRNKSVIICSNGEKYYFMGDPGASVLLAGKNLEIVYLSKTHFLLRITPYCNPTEKSYIEFVKKYFSEYWTKKILK